jgi:hypothetical protein
MGRLAGALGFLVAVSPTAAPACRGSCKGCYSCLGPLAAIALLALFAGLPTGVSPQDRLLK